MSDRFWDGDWPNLASISIALPIGFAIGVSPAVTGVMYRLVAYIARRGVHSLYGAPPEMDPSLPASDRDLRKIAQCTKRELAAARAYFDVLFEERDGRLRLTDDTIIRYTKPLTREAITRDAKAAVAAREGLRCVYCGTIEGPFHYDHIFPVSRGGRNEANNLVVACGACNISKNDRTLVEWMAFKRDER